MGALGRLQGGKEAPIRGTLRLYDFLDFLRLVLSVVVRLGVTRTDSSASILTTSVTRMQLHQLQRVEFRRPQQLALPDEDVLQREDPLARLLNVLADRFRDTATHKAHGVSSGTDGGLTPGAARTI